MIFYMSFYIYDMPCDIKYVSLDRCYVPNYLRLPRHFDSGIFKGIFCQTPLIIARKRQA